MEELFFSPLFYYLWYHVVLYLNYDEDIDILVEFCFTFIKFELIGF